MTFQKQSPVPFFLVTVPLFCPMSQMCLIPLPPTPLVSLFSFFPILFKYHYLPQYFFLFLSISNHQHPLSDDFSSFLALSPIIINAFPPLFIKLISHHLFLLTITTLHIMISLDSCKMHRNSNGAQNEFPES